MKKKGLILTALTVVTAITIAAVAFAADPIKLFVNGKEIVPDIPPQIVKGRTMVPVRWVAEALEADIEWNKDTQTVSVSTKDNSKSAYLGMEYLQLEYKQRFVENEQELLFLPDVNSGVQRTIVPNTLIEVNDLVQVKNERWLYATVPVYDTPMNVKGWIKEADTVPFTKEKEKKVQSDVRILAGTTIYEVSDFADISVNTAQEAVNDIRGRLVEKNENFAKISAPGGMEFWVEEAKIVYPSAQL